MERVTKRKAALPFFEYLGDGTMLISVIDSELERKTIEKAAGKMCTSKRAHSAAFYVPYFIVISDADPPEAKRIGYADMAHFKPNTSLAMTIR